MPLSLRVVFRLMVGFAAAVLLSASASAADPTPKQLAAQLRETLTGLHTIEMRYRHSVENSTGETYVNHCEWIRDGERVRLLKHSGGLPAAFWSFDGRHGYSAGSSHERPGFPIYISKLVSPPPQSHVHFTPPEWLGLRLRGADGTLADLLDREQTRVIGSEVWNGLTVYRVDLGVHEKRAGDPWAWTAVVCPERDGLPVEIARSPADDHPRLERLRKLAGTVRYTVSAFGGIEDQALGRRRWLPWAMRYEVPTLTETLEVTSAQVNHDAPASMFIPQPQPGTEMIDETVPGKRIVRIYAPERALKRQAGALAKTIAPTKASQDGSAAIASPPDPGRWWRWVRWTGAAALFLAAAAFVVRSLRAG